MERGNKTTMDHGSCRQAHTSQRAESRIQSRRGRNGTFSDNKKILTRMLLLYEIMYLKTLYIKTKTSVIYFLCFEITSNQTSCTLSVTFSGYELILPYDAYKEI